MGFLFSIDSFIIASVEAWEIKSKCGVSPFITQPSAKKASYFLIFFEIVTGISKAPGTLIILIVFDLGINFNALSRSSLAISL